MTSPIIETQRLRVRPLTEDDLPALARMRSDADVSRYLGTTAMQTPEFIARRLRFYLACYESHGFGTSAVEERSGGELIGTAGLQPLEETGEIEVGYAFDKPYWGRGYATEVAAAWLRYGFGHAGLERIVAVADPENTGSRRVMEKLGMKFEKVEKHYGFDCVFYAITRGEFRPHDSFFAVRSS